jgi:sialate O-acetylesterase
MKILHGLVEGQVLPGTAVLRGICAAAGAVRAVLVDAGNGRAERGWRGREVGAARSGCWLGRLEGLPAGGPWRLELSCGGARAVVREFYVGEVWLLAGQSNMQGAGRLAGAPGPHPLVRCFSLRREWRLAEEPLHLNVESPDLCHNSGAQCSRAEGRRLRRVAKKGVGPGLFFALEMLRRTGLPQGLICAARGATSMAQWSPEKPGLFYASALASIRATGQPVTGVLWYQGESDTDAAAAAVYGARMGKLIAAFRRDLRQPRLPWLMVQIGRVFDAHEDAPWQRVQEEQRLLPGTVGNLSVVAAVDLPLDDNIHVGADGQRVLGLRLALEAMRLVHGAGKVPPPRLKRIRPPRRGVAEVKFDAVAGGLRAAGEPGGFAVVDGEGRDLRQIFRTTLHGDTVRLHLNYFPAGARICYGATCVSTCNLTDGRGQALPVFAPQVVGAPRAWLPFVTTWRVTPPALSALPLHKIALPCVSGGEVRTYGGNAFNLDGFVNERPRWEGRSGIACFAAQVTLPEAMRVRFSLGYDGPFRLWVDGEPFFLDQMGTNPCYPDERGKAIRLAAGRHALHVAMDTNRGNAWGFFLRLERLDVSPAQILSGDYRQPSYQVL